MPKLLVAVRYTPFITQSAGTARTARDGAEKRPVRLQRGSSGTDSGDRTMGRALLALALAAAAESAGRRGPGKFKHCFALSHALGAQLL